MKRSADWKTSAHEMEIEAELLDDKISSYGEDIVVEPIAIKRGSIAGISFDLSSFDFSNYSPPGRRARANKAAQEAEYKARQEEEKKRATTISKLEPGNTISVDGLQSKLYKVISSSTKPLHMNEIIVGLANLGWSSKSQYHQYASIYRAIRANYFLFEKVGKATFRMRGSFESVDSPKEASQDALRASSAETASSTPIASLGEVLAGVLRDYAIPWQTASSVHTMAVHMGLRVSYSAVRKALLDRQLFMMRGGKFRVRG